MHVEPQAQPAVEGRGSSVANGWRKSFILPRLPLARRFLLLSFVLGVAYGSVNPPFAVNDERAHWLRASEISTGRIRSRADGQGPYHLVPTEYEELILRYGKVQQDEQERVDADALWHDLTTPSDAKWRWRRGVANASSYTPVPYLPQLPALWLARVFTLPPLWQVYLARLASLACFALAGAWAVQIADRLGPVFLVLGLMPMMLTQAAALSGDTMPNALSLVFFALLGRGAVLASGSLSRRELAALFGCGVLLALCKPTYLMLSLALPALRWEGEHRRFKRWAFAGGVLAAAVAAEAAWIYANRTAWKAGNDQIGQQLAWMLSHPIDVLHVAALTLFRYGDDCLIQFGALRDVIHSQMRFLGVVVATLYVQLLLLVAWGAAWSWRRDRRTSRAMAGWLLLAAAASCAAILGALYLVATPVGAATVAGVQGRYFIPVAPAFLLALSACGRPALTRWLSTVRSRHVQAAIVLLNALCVGGLWARYFGSPLLDWPY
jgi:uncharacterized membrane protein